MKLLLMAWLAAAGLYSVSAAAPLPRAPGAPRLTGEADPLERWGWYVVRSKPTASFKNTWLDGKWLPGYPEKFWHLGYFVRGKEVARREMP